MPGKLFCLKSYISTYYLHVKQFFHSLHGMEDTWGGHPKPNRLVFAVNSISVKQNHFRPRRNIFKYLAEMTDPVSCLGPPLLYLKPETKQNKISFSYRNSRSGNFLPGLCQFCSKNKLLHIASTYLVYCPSWAASKYD